jgi:hypothetical protein
MDLSLLFCDEDAVTVRVSLGQFPPEQHTMIGEMK